MVKTSTRTTANSYLHICGTFPFVFNKNLGVKQSVNSEDCGKNIVCYGFSQASFPDICSHREHPEALTGVPQVLNSLQDESKKADTCVANLGET